MKQKLNDHTPGPWAVEAGWNDPGQFTVTAPTHYSGERGLISSTDGTPWLERREANARLIAAAPEMLAALEACLPWLGKAVFYDLASLPVETSKEDLSSVLSMAGKAIAKARGEA